MRILGLYNTRRNEVKITSYTKGNVLITDYDCREEGSDTGFDNSPRNRIKTSTIRPIIFIIDRKVKAISAINLRVN